MTTKTQRQRTASGKLPRSFRLIQLGLAREPKHPAGNPDFGYHIIAPLDANGRIDPVLWKQHREACKVVRFRPNEEDDLGHLQRRGVGWTFHYDICGDEADEAGYRFGHERFDIGEYVSIREDDGMHTYKVVLVRHV